MSLMIRKLIENARDCCRDGSCGQRALADLAEAELKELSRANSELLALLEDLARLEDGERCWCSLPVMIPYRGHEGSCIASRAAIEKAEDAKGKR
jgi:hypothetical protein